MKETKIAEKNIFYSQSKVNILWGKFVAQRHKETCQRWLEFLEEKHTMLDTPDFDEDDAGLVRDEMKKKIQDLKQAIKLYNEAGI